MSPLLTIPSTVPIHYFADVQATSDAVTAKSSAGIYTTVNLSTDANTWCPCISCSACPLTPVKRRLNTSSCSTAAHQLLLDTYPNLKSTNPEWFL